MENRIYVSIPLDALIVSGITSDCAVQISAMDGAILIERCDDDSEECVVATASAMSAEQSLRKARTSNAQVVQSSRKKRKNYNPF